MGKGKLADAEKRGDREGDPLVNDDSKFRADVAESIGAQLMDEKFVGGVVNPFDSTEGVIKERMNGGLIVSVDVLEPSGYTLTFTFSSKLPEEKRAIVDSMIAKLDARIPVSKGFERAQESEHAEEKTTGEKSAAKKEEVIKYEARSARDLIDAVNGVLDYSNKISPADHGIPGNYIARQ